jgi:hypothetical protein
MRIFKGTILAGLLLAVSLLARVVVLQAQEGTTIGPPPTSGTGATIGPIPGSGSSEGGNANIGPHEAGNSPAITDKVSGLPVVVIVRPEENWPGKIAAWSSASPLVVRVTGITVETTVSQAQAMGAQAASLPAGTIVVFGNELNNLDHEWKSRSVAPAVGTAECSHGATNGDVSGAARQYGALFNAFAAAAGSGVRVAPAPADMHNDCYSGSVWMQAASAVGVYSSATALVANAYDTTPIVNRTAQQDVDDVQAIAGRPVDFLTEFGPHPSLSVREHLDFLNSTNPPNGLKAATLVPNRCGQPVGANQQLPPTDMWLYYVNGQLYNKGGQLVEVGEGNDCTATSIYPPPFVMPDANATEMKKYLANSQVYCAPNQAFDPKIEGQMPDLTVCVEHSNVAEQQAQLGGYPLATKISLNDQTCNQAEYPLIDANETWDVMQLSFPLFRDDAGGISVEADLSRVDPTDTFAEAAKRNSRPDYAPQFYLTSPEMQCRNAVNHLQYVAKICEQYSQSGGAEGCLLNPQVELADGSLTSLLALRSELPDETVCANISADMANPNSLRGQAVRAISTQTPKQYKLAFFVQHTYMHEPRADGNKGYVLQNWLGIDAIATWFARGTPINETLFPGEVVDIIPVWYNAGLALSAYDEYLDPNGEVKPYNYDPETLPRETDPSTLSPNENNFISGWNQTYAAVLPMHIQQRINAEIRNTVADTWAIMNDIVVGVQGAVNANGFDIEEPIIECYDRQCLCYGDSTAEELGQVMGGSAYAGQVAQNCASLTMSQVASALPAPFSVPNTPDGRSFMYDFKELIIQRINAGVQRSEPFDPSKEAPEDYRGPLGQRSFDRCPVEPEEYGIQESATSITSSGNQQLVPAGQAAEEAPVDDPTLLSGARQSIANLTRDFVAKILPGAQVEQQFKDKKTSRAYLILPDEALTIEKTQSYVAPMFFSPQMYASIMTGMNPIYPFAQGGAITEELSAFLRTQGLNYNVDSEPDGYGVYEATVSYYRASTGGCTIDPNTGTQTCGCIAVPTGLSETRWLRQPIDGAAELTDLDNQLTWIEKGDYQGSGPASCSRLYSIEVSEVQRSTVDLDKQPRENPNPETPGQLAAMNEFLRRMAFLPLHMVQKYAGLEKFYQGYGGGRVANDETIPGGSTKGTGASQCSPRTIDTTKYAAPAGTPAGQNPAFDKAVCDSLAKVGNTDPLAAAFTRAILSSEGNNYGRASNNGTPFDCKPNSAGAFEPMGIVVGACASPRSSLRPDLNTTKEYDLCLVEDAVEYALRNIIPVNFEQARRDLGSGNPGDPTKSREYKLLEIVASYYAGGGPGNNYCGQLAFQQSSGHENDGGAKINQGSGTQRDYCAYIANIAAESTFRNFAQQCQ